MTPDLYASSFLQTWDINGYQYSGVHYYGDRWGNLMIGTRMGNNSEPVKVKFPGGWVVVEMEGLSYGSVPEHPLRMVKVTL